MDYSIGQIGLFDLLDESYNNGISITLNQSGKDFFKIIESIRDLAFDNIPNNSDRQLLISYLNHMEHHFIPSYFSQEGEIQRLYMTGNFMKEELATFFNRTLKDINNIVKECNIE